MTGSARLRATVDALRSALTRSPEVLPFTLDGTIDEQTAAAAETGVPREFLDFCIGMNDITPIFLDRAGGGVLGIPDEHWEWVDAEHFEQLALKLEEFFLERLTTPRYLQ